MSLPQPGGAEYTSNDTSGEGAKPQDPYVVFCQRQVPLLRSSAYFTLNAGSPFISFRKFMATESSGSETSDISLPELAK